MEDDNAFKPAPAGNLFGVDGTSVLSFVSPFIIHLDGPIYRICRPHGITQDESEECRNKLPLSHRAAHPLPLPLPHSRACAAISDLPPADAAAAAERVPPAALLSTLAAALRVSGVTISSRLL